MKKRLPKEQLERMAHIRCIEYAIKQPHVTVRELRIIRVFAERLTECKKETGD